MDAKIQELVDKIQKEGVNKGTQEAERIVSEATEKAKSIIADAEKMAEELIEKAKRENEELRKKAEQEIRIASTQVVETSKTAISNIISGAVVSQSVAKSFEKEDFLNELILTLAKSFDASKGIEINTNQEKELRAFFELKAKELLSQGVKINSVNSRRANFEIVPEGEGFKLKFGEKEFEELFASFLKPHIAEILFAK